MLLLKFGKKEHLEQLKSGSVHFRPVEYFQNEPTDFRGDSMEGKLYVDSTKPILINGFDISPYVEEVTQTYQINGTVLSFSASKLSKKVCHLNDDGTFTPNNDFISEMLKFGEYVLAFNGYEFIDKLRETLGKQNCPFKYRSILYCDKKSPKGVESLFSGLTEEDKDLVYYFIKDNDYSIQNEWRMVLSDIDNLFTIGANGGVNIETEFNTEMPIFKTADLITLKCSDTFLFD